MRAVKVAAATIVVLFGLTRDLWTAFVSTGALAIGWALVHIRQRVPGSFAQGFLAYRADDQWPRGVQEEYDVKWSSSGDAARSRS
jgi:hypothetical protein